MFKMLITALVIILGWYYTILVAQLLGIIEITGLEKKNKFNWKAIIPFYQFFILFKNESKH